MSEKPILFKPELVKAILDGRKTETRRIIKPQPTIQNGTFTPGMKHLFFEKFDGWALPMYDDGRDLKYLIGDMLEEGYCPHGKVGDVLWVRETWGVLMEHIIYKADFLDEEHYPVKKWKPSIHMPKKYCRLRLKITDIGVERLQDITVEDIIAEGVEPIPVEVHSKDDMIDAIRFSLNKPKILLSHKAAWIELWDKINASRGHPWESNPWLWCLKFEVVR